jgi:hypothetical protein
VRARVYLILSLVFLFVFSGCSSKPEVAVKHFDFNESYTPSSWEKIVVLPFSGDKKSRRTSPEWFSFHLQKQQHYSIVTPSFAEIEIANKGMDVPKDMFSIEQARQAGSFLEADAVFIGDVETEKRSQSPVKLLIQLVDVKTGDTIAKHTIGYPSWVFLWDNMQEYVRLATDVAGRDFLKVLNGLAEGKQIEPSPESASSTQYRKPNDS